VDFIALDVETANSDMSSICQIGIAKYIDSQLVEEWSSLINPEDYFNDINTSIHGITEKDVLTSPTFPELANELGKFLNNTVCVCHTHFDRVSISKAAAKYGLEVFTTDWLDSARVARRAWPQFSERGYGLGNISAFLGYEFEHHDALEDAKAAGQIILAASKEINLDIDGWLRRVNLPISPTRAQTSVARDGDPEGTLHGEVIVFTGTLDITRSQAADLAAAAGCQVKSGVTKKVTLLVVGDQDVQKLAGHRKSSKHRKAEQLISEGIPIRILRETDFKEMVKTST